MDRKPERSLLEPADWAEFREQAHRALDSALDHVQQRPEQPVWGEIPPHIKAVNAPLPRTGESLDSVVKDIEQRILPYTLGNTHPRFWGWVNGSGTPSAVVAQMFMGAINANLGGRDHAPIYIERQVIAWMRELYGYPSSASGLICTGTSSATLLGLSIARQRALGEAVRAEGNPREGSRLLAYCSIQAHVSVSKAMELLGLGSDALRLVPVGDDFAMDCDALAAMLAQDVADGGRPFAIVSSVGSVNTGAIDDLHAVNGLCQKYGLWHHVDGAFGALIALSDKLRPRLAGVEKADSIAFDYHKWMHVTYAAACLLVRDGQLHYDSFATAHPYLRGDNKGAAGGAPWPNDYGIDLSRGFAALGVWMQMKEQGVEALGHAIERNCDQAAWLGQQVQSDESLELMAPVSLNIVCFRYRISGMDEEQLNRFNRHLVVELHCRGIAVPSFTELDGRTAIRVCVANHRTRIEDLQALLEAVHSLAGEFAASGDYTEDFVLDR